MTRHLLVALLLIAAAPAAHALRCDGNLTHAGDFEYQVRDHCGEPFWVDQRTKFEAYGNEQQQYVREVHYTYWFYNFGANQFMARLTFRDGHLANEEKLGRGVEELGAGCDRTRIGRGMTSGELVAYCGEPASRYEQPGVIARRLSPVYAEQDDEVREEWIYDFGEDFVYVATLVNGTVNGVVRRRR
jgi:hypothetical protein